VKKKKKTFTNIEFQVQTKYGWKTLKTETDMPDLEVMEQLEKYEETYSDKRVRIHAEGNKKVFEDYNFYIVRKDPNMSSKKIPTDFKRLSSFPLSVESKLLKTTQDAGKNIKVVDVDNNVLSEINLDKDRVITNTI